MPKTYTPDQRKKAVKAVISALSKGTPLTVVCSGPGMPCDDTIRIWGEADQEVGREIARARDVGWDRIALDALDIADASHRDTKKGRDGAEIADTEWISRSKLRVETRLKLLAKWDPKRYGEMLKLGNPDGSAFEKAAAVNEARERIASGKQS